MGNQNLNMVNVKSKQPEIKLKDYTVEEGKVVEYTPEDQKKELSKVTEPTSITFNEMSKDDFKHHIQRRMDAVEVIKEKMVEGKHYMDLPGVEKSMLTQEGADLLFASSGVTVETTEEKEILDHDRQFYMVIYKATASINGKIVASTDATANSKEENNIKKFIDLKKGEQKGDKTFYDTMNTVIRMAQKRAKVALARQFFAITGEFNDDNDNPKANKRTHQSVYTLFYKHFLDEAPKAPTKKKLKNGKWKQYTAKEQLQWRKDHIRATILQPKLLEMGLSTYEWGIKDIEIIKKAIPTWKGKELSDDRKIEEDN